MAASIAWECGGKALLVSAALSKNATASIAARDSAIDSLGNPAFVGLSSSPLELTPGSANDGGARVLGPPSGRPCAEA